ncbi:MAG: hypothetical protein LBS05_05425 [Tannerellaceae bacterium]|jgi:hypothetical protein|nr:hypothetical protein [Tannerellaceae bacterium]
MKKGTQELDCMKGEKPFLVPEGYMENLTPRVMSELPERTYANPKRITTMEYIRPWLYMASVFAGLGLFVNLLIGKGDSGHTVVSDSLLVHTTIPQDVYSDSQDEEEADYLEFIESQYVGYILAEEMGEYE